MVLSTYLTAASVLNPSPWLQHMPLWATEHTALLLPGSEEACIKKPALYLRHVVLLHSGGNEHAASGMLSKLKQGFVLVHWKLPRKGKLVSSPGSDTCCFYLLTDSGKHKGDDMHPEASCCCASSTARTWGETDPCCVCISGEGMHSYSC